jgi:hypothetical protein
VEARPRRKTLLWVGAAVTAGAAVFFPGMQGIRDSDDSWWRLATSVPRATAAIVIGAVAFAVGTATCVFDALNA